MKKLLLSLLCAAASLTAAADSWSYTVAKDSNGKYTKHDISQIAVGTQSDIVFNKDENDEQTWNILITSISSSSPVNKPSNDGNAPLGIMFGSAANPAQDITLYSASNFSGKTITKVTIIVNGGAKNNCSYDATVTVGSFTETKSKAVTGQATNGTTLSWTPQTDGEIIINLHNNTTTVGSGKNSGIKLCSITVEYTEGTTPAKTPVTLSWTPESDNLDFGAEFTAPIFNCSDDKAHNLVVFQSDNTDLLNYVDSEWKLTPNVSGTAHITASIPEDNETYTTTPAVYTLTVAEKQKTPSQLAFSASEWSVMEGTEDLSGAPTLSNELGIEVTYSSSNENVATFVDGVMMIGDPGTTVITATPKDTDNYTGDATYTLTVTPRPVLGAITVNGSEVADNATVTTIVNTPVIFASENAETLNILVMNSNTDFIVNEENYAGNTYTWTPSAIDTYEIEITAAGSNAKPKSVSFTIEVAEKPAISPVADFIFAGDDANVVALASKTIEATNKTTNDDPNDLEGVVLTAENGANITFAITESKANHTRYWLTTDGDKEARFYKNTNMTIAAPDNYAISSIVFTQSAANKSKWNLSNPDNGILEEMNWNNNRMTVKSVVFTAIDRTDIGAISVTIVPLVAPAAPIVTIDGNEITDFENDIDLKDGPKEVVITAADAAHHIYHKHAPESAQNVAPLADTEDGYTWVPANTATVTVSETGAFTFYTHNPLNGLKSEDKTLKFKNSTAIVEVEAGISGEAEWFDLTGRRVGKPAKGGVYILKEGSKTSKRAF